MQFSIQDILSQQTTNWEINIKLIHPIISAWNQIQISWYRLKIYDMFQTKDMKYKIFPYRILLDFYWSWDTSLCHAIWKGFAECPIQDWLVFHILMNALGSDRPILLCLVLSSDSSSSNRVIYTNNYYYL